jgi:hypothetical protein
VRFDEIGPMLERSGRWLPQLASRVRRTIQQAPSSRAPGLLDIGDRYESFLVGAAT